MSNLEKESGNEELGKRIRKRSVHGERLDAAREAQKAKAAEKGKRAEEWINRQSEKQSTKDVVQRQENSEPSRTSFCDDDPLSSRDEEKLGRDGADISILSEVKDTFIDGGFEKLPEGVAGRLQREREAVALAQMELAKEKIEAERERMRVELERLRQGSAASSSSVASASEQMVDRMLRNEEKRADLEAQRVALERERLETEKKKLETKKEKLQVARQQAKEKKLRQARQVEERRTAWTRQSGIFKAEMAFNALSEEDKVEQRIPDDGARGREAKWWKKALKRGAPANSPSVGGRLSGLETNGAQKPRQHFLSVEIYNILGSIHDANQMILEMIPADLTVVSLQTVYRLVVGPVRRPLRTWIYKMLSADCDVTITPAWLALVEERLLRAIFFIQWVAPKTLYTADSGVTFSVGDLLNSILEQEQLMEPKRRKKEFKLKGKDYFDNDNFYSQATNHQGLIEVHTEGVAREWSEVQPGAEEDNELAGKKGQACARTACLTKAQFSRWWRELERAQASQSPVNRLKEFSSEAKRFPRRLRRIIAKGLWTRLRKKHTRRRMPEHYIQDPAELAFARKEIQALIESGALVEVTGETKRKSWVHPYFVIRGTNKWRLVVDLRKLNEAIVEGKSVSYDDLAFLASIVKPGDRMFKLDLTSAFHHVGLAASLSSRIAIRVGSKVYQFQVMCFGLAIAPKIFMAIMREVLKPLKTLGIRFALYIDDIAVLLPKNQPDPLSIVKLCVEQLVKHGFIISWKKSQLLPASKMEFLGLLIDAKRMEMKVPNRKVVDIANLAAVVAQRPEVKTKTIAKVVGKIISIARAFGPAKKLIWHLVMDLKGAVKKAGWKGRTEISLRARSDMVWLAENLKRHRSKRILLPRNPVAIETDASKTGWGGWCPATKREAYGFWSVEESKEHIMVLEMRAIIHTVRELDLREMPIHIWTDNMAVMHYVNRWGGAGNMALLLETHRLWSEVWDRKLYLTGASYINTKENVVADRLSRLSPPNSSKNSEPVRRK